MYQILVTLNTSADISSLTFQLDGWVYPTALAAETCVTKSMRQLGFKPTEYTLAFQVMPDDIAA